MTCEDLCKQFEGCRLEAYKCPGGVWTIGYGHTDKVAPGQKITQDEAEKLLREDVNRHRTFVRQLVNAPLKVTQFEALTDFCFNLGPGNLRGSTLLKKVNRNPNDLSIRDEFMKWTKANFQILPGLVARRKAEADLYFS